MDDLAFTTAYNRLNTEQKKAVDTIEGPVMVIAGPGTGKTQILTLRIANILKQTDIGPENILALTFTESGARAMRERLASYIGAAAYRVGIHTFHEFAGILIRTYPDAYERTVGGKPITDLEKITVLETILDTPSIKHLRPGGNPEFYIKPIMSAISTMKREYITPSVFAEIIQDQEAVLHETQKVHEKGAHAGKIRGEYIEREKKLLKNKELLFVYKAYEAALQSDAHFDYDDMIYETVTALMTHEDMLRSLQEQYQYILADEHQDVNGSQNKILELLASFHERPNIFVVGDEKQSIYRFQGASLENFLFFEEKFPHAVTIALTENYRSVQSVLDLSHELITAVPSAADALRVPLTATRTDTPILERRQFSHEAVEHESIVGHIEARIQDGVPPHEIAIILRTNKEVEEFGGYLRSKNIPVETTADGDILSHPITIHIQSLIRAVLHPHDENALFSILHSGYAGIPVRDLVVLMQARSYNTPLVVLVEDAQRLTELGIKNVDAITRIPKILKSARDRMQVESPHRILAYILEEVGFIHHAIAMHPYEGGRVVRRLYDEIEEMVRHEKSVTLFDIEHMFLAYRTHGLALTAPYINASRSAVQIMTAHKAKGLEFLHVYIPHLTDSKWGGRSHPVYFHIPLTRHVSEESDVKDEDERKLLYVALTRAKVGLYMSGSATNTEGRALLPTRFLEGIGESLVKAVDTTSEEDSFNPVSSLEASLDIPYIDRELLSTVLTARGLSATALNNYLKDPWNYFYRNVLRVPEIQPESAQFGTALHDTLRSVMKHRREKGGLPHIHELKQYLERELGKLAITPNEYERHYERAMTALLTYIDHVSPHLPHETKEEYKIQVMLPTGDPEFPEVLLTGQLDRLDFDEEGKLMRVVDYKSGKPKTRGFIEGTTKDSTGDYKRQLVFYALILSLQDKPELHTREGVLSFIESDEKGVIHEEIYQVTEEEVEALKTEIIRVVHEIRTGAFLTHVCDPERSDYCDLVASLQQSIRQK